MDEYMTVELTLDNDEVVEPRTETYIFTAIQKMPTASLNLRISKMTMNMRSLPMLSTNGWIPRNSKNQATMNSSFTKREGLRLFPFFSFT